MKAGPIEAWEIDKAKNIARRGFVSDAREFAPARGHAVAARASSTTIPNLINTRWERTAAVTAADVQRVAQKYLTVENRSVVITNPKPVTPGAAAGRPGGRTAMTRRIPTATALTALLGTVLLAQLAAQGGQAPSPPRAS